MELTRAALPAGARARSSVYLHAQPSQPGGDVLPRRRLRGAGPQSNLLVSQVEDEAMHDRFALFGRQRPDLGPERVIRQFMLRFREMARPNAVKVFSPMARAAPHGVGGLVLGDGVEPRAQVRRVPQPWVGTQRGEQRLLEAVLCLNRTHRGDQEPMQLRGMRVDQ